VLADGRLTGAIPRLTARQDTCGLALTRRAWPGQSSSGEDGTPPPPAWRIGSSGSAGGVLKGDGHGRSAMLGSRELQISDSGV
jgi:hypothetical protein